MASGGIDDAARRQVGEAGAEHEMVRVGGLDGVAAALRRRAVVGYHWFEHADQPAQGRFDGENSNFGTVTIEDDVYQELTQAMTAVNAEAEALHEASALAA
jgi:hypothetical protein